MAASAARSVSISPRLWNDRPPTSRCGTPRASSARTYEPRHVLPETDESAEQQADVPRLDRDQALLLRWLETEGDIVGAMSASRASADRQQIGRSATFQLLS